MLQASSLKSNESQKKYIKSVIKDLLNTIDSELKESHKDSKQNLETKLPITFTIPNMNNADAQRIVYSSIIESLEKRGFIVEIEIKSTSTVLYIRWLNDEEHKEIQIQNLILAKHAKKRG
jgi:aspartyl/asparaginyl-tRNA synthetase